jgi:hypothetical protein
VYAGTDEPYLFRRSESAVGIPSIAATARSPRSVIPKATAGCCRRSRPGCLGASTLREFETVLPTPSNEASENPLPILKKRHPPPSASESSATRRHRRNTHRTGSCSSCAGDRAAGPDLPLHTLFRSSKGPVGPPRRIRNTTGGHPATTHEGSRAPANSAPEARCEPFFAMLGKLAHPPVPVQANSALLLSPA